MNSDRIIVAALLALWLVPQLIVGGHAIRLALQDRRENKRNNKTPNKTPEL